MDKKDKAPIILLYIMIRDMEFIKNDLTCRIKFYEEKLKEIEEENEGTK